MSPETGILGYVIGERTRRGRGSDPQISASDSERIESTAQHYWLEVVLAIEYSTRTYFRNANTSINVS